MSWHIERSRGPAGPFHQQSFDDLDQRTVWIHEVEEPALVLGSTTDEGLVRNDRAIDLGIEICRRRSGGGLVLVEPNNSCWIDLLLPRDDPWWDDDVNRSFNRVGQTWLRALTACGVGDAEVYDGPLTERTFGRAICFAGLGPGEVVVPAASSHRDGLSKVVGLSQRRTKAGARFQGLFVASWSAARLADVVHAHLLPEGLDLESLAIGVPGGGPEPSDIEAAFLSELDLD